MNLDLSSINTISIMIRLLLSVVCGGLIGLERGRAGRPAGFRTHILVCMGSAMAMLTNQYVFQMYGTGDMTRMGAQVVSGIGFLGAGTIIVTGSNKVKGLTTAAGLWATACMGLAIGVGFYTAAVFGCMLISFVTVALHRLDNYLLSRSKVLDVYIEYDSSYSIGVIIDCIKKQMIHIDTIEVVRPTYGNTSLLAVVMTLRVKKKQPRLETIAKVCDIEGVVFAEEI